MIKIRISTCHHILYFIWSILGKYVLGMKFMYFCMNSDLQCKYEKSPMPRSVARMDSRITHRDLSILNKLSWLNQTKCKLHWFIQ